MRTFPNLFPAPGISIKNLTPPPQPIPLGPGVTEPDPAWRTLDSNGHGHIAQPIPGSVDYPTLEWISEPCSMGHGEDCDSEGAWHCLICGEVVQPGRRPASPIFEKAPGRYELKVVDAQERSIVTCIYDLTGQQVRDLGVAAAEAIKAYLLEAEIQPTEIIMENC